MTKTQSQPYVIKIVLCLVGLQIYDMVTALLDPPQRFGYGTCLWLETAVVPLVPFCLSIAGYKV